MTAGSRVVMHSPAPEIVAGYRSGCVADKDANPETTLGSAYSPVDYMSITSFPRLPEDDVMSGENTLKSRKDDDNILSEQDTGQSARSDIILHSNYWRVCLGCCSEEVIWLGFIKLHCFSVT